MSDPITLELPLGKNIFFEGDTISSIDFNFGQDDNIDLTLEGTELRMQLYTLNCSKTKILDISIGNGITVIGPKAFKFDEISKEDNKFKEGAYIGDLELTDFEGKRSTICRVKYKIHKQYTK